jgi:transcriptional regulator with XRE-family HTH domain
MDGVKLVSARVRMGLSVRGLAEKSRVNSQSIHKIEKGLILRPHPATVKALADALELDPAEIDEFRSVLGLPPV